MKPKTPRAPDPVQLGQQQGQANQQAAQQTLALNAQDRTNPFGSVQFTRNAAGVPTGQNVTLNPELQSTVSNVGTAASNLSGLLPQDRFRLADVPQGIDVSQNFFDQAKSLLQPGFDDQIRDFEVRAAERGLPVGSEAFTAFLDPVLRNQGRSLDQAAFNAISLTPGEEDRQLRRALTERGQPAVETSQILGLLGQVPVPGFAPQPQAGIAAPNFAGLAQQGFQNQANLAQQQNAALGSLLGAAGGIAGTAFGGPFGGAAGSALGSTLGGAFTSPASATPAGAQIPGFQTASFPNTLGGNFGRNLFNTGFGA